MGSVRYETVATLKRHGTGGGLVGQARELVTRKEIPVRSVETRQGRHALETPVFQIFQVASGGVGNMLNGSIRRGVPKIDLAVKMPRAGFMFGKLYLEFFRQLIFKQDEQIPFTIDILNTSSTGLVLTDIAIEERVAVIYMDKSKWGPITTTRVPFPFKEHVPPSAHNESRSFRLGLPRLEPQTPLPFSTQQPESFVSSALRRGRRISAFIGGGDDDSDDNQQQQEQQERQRIGLNASFQTQPLKVTHHLTFKVRRSSSSKTIQKPITIDIPIVLITCRRETSLLYQSESLVALVEEAERDEEEQERRREGGGSRRGTNRRRSSSVDTLPKYEPGEDGVIVLESFGGEDVFGEVGIGGSAGFDAIGSSVEGQAESSSSDPRQYEGEVSVVVNEEGPVEYEGPPPSYDVFGFDDSAASVYSSAVPTAATPNIVNDGGEIDDAEAYLADFETLEEGMIESAPTPLRPSTSSSSSSVMDANPIMSHSFSSSSVRSTYCPPGDNVISLAPFIDNNPPSFQESTVTVEEGGALNRRPSFSNPSFFSLQRSLERQRTVSDLNEDPFFAPGGWSGGRFRKRVSQIFGLSSLYYDDDYGDDGIPEPRTDMVFNQQQQVLQQQQHQLMYDDQDTITQMPTVIPSVPRIERQLPPLPPPSSTTSRPFSQLRNGISRGSLKELFWKPHAVNRSGSVDEEMQVDSSLRPIPHTVPATRTGHRKWGSPKGLFGLLQSGGNVSRRGAWDF
ncbi:UNVERIFIED_CONTAM: hypothetical protein HDU68_002158 [Siphonaria sp. JEL0065]|nr:hypothetical protein HDU68_002158 [Siphonaria sp. JEL0065]